MLRASASATQLASRVVTSLRRSSSHLALSPIAVTRSIRRLPLYLKVVMALAVLTAAWLCLTLIGDAGFRDRIHRSVTGHKRRPDARVSFPAGHARTCSERCRTDGWGGGNSGRRTGHRSPMCIPKTVHITYNSGGVLRHHRIVEGALTPEYNFQYYSDEQAERYVAHNCTEYLEVYECFLPTAYKADVFRYCVLLHEGGLYMDNDFALLVHPEPYMYNVSCGGVYLLAEYQENYGEMVRVWTGIMISSPQMIVWRCMLESIKANIRKKFYGKNPLDITGPEQLARCIQAHPEDIHPVGWNEKDGTMWLYPERNDGKFLQIGHEVNTKFKDESRWKRPLHYHAQWQNKQVYSDHCKL